MEKYIAVIRHPRSYCCEDYYDDREALLISASTGLVEKVIDISEFSFSPNYRRETIYEYYGEPFTIYDKCAVQRYKVGELVDNVSSIYPMWSNEECNERNIPTNENSNDALVLTSESVGYCKQELFGKIKLVHTWKVTMQYAKIVDTIYHPIYPDKEDDDFYLRMKKEYNLELPAEVRVNVSLQDIIKMIADKLQIELLNIVI